MSKFTILLLLAALVTITIQAPQDNGSGVNVIDGDQQVNVVDGDQQVNVVDGVDNVQPRNQPTE